MLMRFLAEAGLEANNYITPLNQCFCLAIDALTEVPRRLHRSLLFDEVFSAG